MEINVLQMGAVNCVEAVELVKAESSGYRRETARGIDNQTSPVLA
jgi:hypothetical protein